MKRHYSVTGTLKGERCSLYIQATSLASLLITIRSIGIINSTITQGGI